MTMTRKTDPSPRPLRPFHLLRHLKTLGIDHILNCAGPFARTHHDPDIKYEEFDADDAETYDISQNFEQAFEFINKAKESKGKCLVHCLAGVNRSTVVCLAYLIQVQKWPLLRAVRHAWEKRPIILSNEGFQWQLVTLARENELLEDDR